MGQRVITIPLPAAGADFTLKATVPMVVKSVTGIFTTSATVSGRYVYVVVEDASGNTLVRSGIPATFAASQSLRVSGFVNAIPANESGNPGYVLTLPDIVLMPYWTLRSEVGSIQAGDQWSELFAVAWIDDL